MRTRYIQINGELHQVSLDYSEVTPSEYHIVGDRHYDGLRSPIDGADISTRAKHRRYMKENDLTTMDDYKDEWANAAKEREIIQQGIDPTRKQEIINNIMRKK